MQNTQDNVSLKTLVSVLSSTVSKDSEVDPPRNRTIRFPYSRHSSYSELCGLVRAFQPRDVFPCTVDDIHWTPDLSMRNLFGDLCAGDVFCHDAAMMCIYKARVDFEGQQKRSRAESPTDSQMTEDETASTTATKPADERPVILHASNDIASNTAVEVERELTSTILPTLETPPENSFRRRQVVTPGPDHVVTEPPSVTRQKTAASDRPSGKDAPAPSPHKKRRRTNRQLAYDAAIGDNGLSWSDYGGLVSTRSKAAQDEQEL
jgi:hypothetical protein